MATSSSGAQTPKTPQRVLGSGIVGHVDRGVNLPCRNDGSETDEPARAISRNAPKARSQATCRPSGCGPGKPRTQQFTRPGNGRPSKAALNPPMVTPVTVQNSGSRAVRSARCPLARIRPSRTAPARAGVRWRLRRRRRGRPRRRSAGVPLVCRGPGVPGRSSCTAAYGGTRSSTERPAARRPRMPASRRTVTRRAVGSGVTGEGRSSPCTTPSMARVIRKSSSLAGGCRLADDGVGTRRLGERAQAGVRHLAHAPQQFVR